MRRIVFISLVILGFAGSSSAQQPDIKFKNLFVKHGLSEGTIRCILKDQKGFMWFGTIDGLNRYDGYKFSIYKHDPSNPHTIISSRINDILEDTKGNLWIGTATGLDRMDRKKDQFIHCILDSIPLDVRDIKEDSYGKIWVATANAGLFLFNPVDNTFKGYYHDEKNENSLTHNEVNKILEYSPGILWLATRNGLDQLDANTNIITHIRPDSTKPKSISGIKIRDLYKDHQGNIWLSMHRSGIAFYNKKDSSFTDYKYDGANPKGIPDQFIVCLAEGPDGKMWLGTENVGLCVFDYKNNTFSSYRPDILNPSSISYQTIQSLYLDDVGNMWVGTNMNGVSLVSKNASKFTHHTQIPCTSNSLSRKSVFSIFEDSAGRLWIGTDGGGLNLYDRKKNLFTHYRADSTNKNSISADRVYSILEIKKGVLGIGYSQSGGLDFFDVEKGVFTHHLPETLLNDPKTMAGKSVNCLLKDHEGNLWIGTGGSGLNFYDSKSKTFTKYVNSKSNSNSISSNYVQDLVEDKSHNIWIATENGLSLFDRQKNKFVNYLHDIKNEHSISDNYIYSIKEDKLGNLWLGTVRGLNLMNRKTQTFISYTQKDGLPNDVIKSIEEDKAGNLWLCTNKGLAKFNPQTKTCKTYDVADGIQGELFMRGASYTNTKGEIFVAGDNGFNIFHPDSLPINKSIPPIVFTDFQIFNKKVPIGINDSPLKDHISETKEITLSYKESVFSFEFASLNYTLPEKNQYAYMMVGFDKDWNYVGDQRKATYTNLDPGSYTFKVKGSNNDGLWNETGTSIKIIITPPFWQTWWFKVLVFITVLGSAVSWYKIRVGAIKKQKTILEQQVRERTAEISMQKEELEAQAEHLKSANTEIKTLFSEIKDSIRAAETIQKSILPNESFIKKYLPESFILYKPKDVVSGDFYWFDVKDGKIIIAAVDCTGHGVSGAFMSINGHHLLNQAIYPYSNLKASEILNRLNEDLIKGLHQEGDKTSNIFDGMDIALCIMDEDKKRLQYAGANNPLYILRNAELIQVKASKHAIGLSVNGKVNTFSNNEVELQKGDILYIFSDGYADQLGGAAGEEKFMYSQFRELLLSIGNESMEKQLELLDKNFNDWKRNLEQLDDILVIGFKIS